MTPREPATITVPGKSFSLRTETKLPEIAPGSVTQATMVVDFQALATLLSKKPLRRPNRTKPIER